MPAGQATNKKYADDGLLIVAFLAILLVLLHVYNVSGRTDLFSWWFPLLNVIAFLLLTWRIYLHWNTRTLKLRWYASQALLMLLMLLALISEFFFHTILSTIKVTEHTSMSAVIYHSVFIFLFLEEFSNRLFSLKKSAVNGGFLLIISFAFLILMGSFLLMLPGATNKPISYVNALFTSTSAVCVTGLTVLDTAQDFTLFGKWIILFLIQTGGLGILTFTNLFGLIFSGNSTFQNQMFIQNMLNVENMGDAFKALVRIIVITLVIEFVGGVFIFFTTSSDFFESGGSHAFFAIFHAVSAFCNAGFSTLGNDNMYHPAFRYAYGFQLVIAVLIVFGGIGFGLFLNILQYFREKFFQGYCKFIKHTAYRFKPKIISLNTRVVMVTTAILLILGTVFYFVFEYNNVLVDHPTLVGKIIQSFFGSVTPRTAGFNTVDISKLTIPTLMIYLLLMWIGGSPGSTAGGIKTSVFAVATLNIVNIIRGHERLETGKREITSTSINKTFAIISLSLIAVGLSITLIVLKDGSKFDLLQIAFEAFSALGTVGLSMGITSSLTDFSKVVLIFTMFIGRVGFMTIMIGLFRLFTREKEKRYRYPPEELFIT